MHVTIEQITSPKAVVTLIGHQKRSSDESCLCGYSELGASHTEHVLSELAKMFADGADENVHTIINEAALTAAHLAVEDVLIDMRDSRMGVLGRANGFIVNEKDGTPSSIMRLGTRDGLRIGIKAYLNALVDQEGAMP
jgi:hypothetical protein